MSGEKKRERERKNGRDAQSDHWTLCAMTVTASLVGSNHIRQRSRDKLIRDRIDDARQSSRAILIVSLQPISNRERERERERKTCFVVSNAVHAVTIKQLIALTHSM